MAARARGNNYSAPSRNQNRLSLQFSPRLSETDRVHNLTAMSMSNYLACHAKLKKRVKVKGKGQVASANFITFLPGANHSRLIVSDNRGGRLSMFQDDGMNGKEIIAQGVRPYGVTGLDSRTIVFVDDNLETGASVKIFSIEDEFSVAGKIVGEWGKSSESWRPRGVAVTKAGQIIVTNVHPEASERFWMCAGDGSNPMSFGRAQGPADLVFRSPNYVTVDEFGRILATDSDGNCVKIFDSRSRYMSEFGNSATDAKDKDTKLLKPMGIVCDQRGNIIVCDSGNRRLVMYSQDGRYIQNLRHPQKIGLYPVGVAFNPASDCLAMSVHDGLETFKKLLTYDFICT